MRNFFYNNIFSVSFILLPTLFIGCAGPTKYEKAEVSENEKHLILANKPHSLQSTYLQLVEEGERNEVLNQMRLGLDALQLGYLQELNRQFLHPLGLALEVIINGEDVRFGDIWDSRDDPEGVIYSEFHVGAAERAKAIERCREEFARHRLEHLGFVIQPIA